MKTLYFESMICLLLSRSTILIRAARSVSVLSPVVERLPEAASVLRDDSKVAKMTQDLLASSTSMQHVPEEDRTKQYVEYHIPTYEYLSTLLQRHRAKDSARPLFVGVSAPQGCGKTTLTSVMCDLFRLEGKHCIAMSLDDFYLPGAQQEQLAKTHAQNNLLELRGNAGTHDLHLAMTTLHSLQNLRKSQTGSAGVASVGSASGTVSNKKASTKATKEVTEVRVPRYDKALRNGRGDRLPRDQWALVTEPVDIVLFEGWMLGFTALPHIDLPVHPDAHRCPAEDLTITATGVHGETVDSTTAAIAKECFKNETQNAEFDKAYRKAHNIMEINEFLRPYEALHLYLHAWLVLAVESPQIVYQWRLEAERQMRDSGRGGMTDEQVADFVDRYMPAYETYLPALYTQGPQRSAARPELLQPVPGIVANSDSTAYNGGDQSTLCPVLKITVGNDRLPTKVEFI